jgi:hypothetical protein
MTPEEELQILLAEKAKRTGSKPDHASGPAEHGEEEVNEPPGPEESEGMFASAGRDLSEARKVGAEGEADFMRGASQGASLSFADEIGGLAAGAGSLFGSARDALTGFGGGEEGAIDAAKRAYREGRNEERAKVEEARKRSPMASTVGQIAGGMLIPGGAASKMATIPGKMAVGGLVGAGTAAASQAGEAEEMEDVPDAVASLPTAIGGAVGALVPGAGPAMSVLRRKGGEALGRAGANADELRVLTTMGATGGSINAPAILREAKNVPGGVPALAETLRKTGISKGVTTTTGIAKRAAEVESKSGAAIGKFIDDATTSGGFVDVNALTARLRAKAAEAVSGGKGMSDIAVKEAKALGKLADRFDEMFAGGVAKPDAIKQASIALGDDASQAYAARAMGKNVEGKGRALMEGRRASEAGISDTIEGLGLPEGYQAAKTAFQGARLAREAADISLGRADKRNFLSLTDAPLLAAGSGGAAVAVSRKALGPFSASARATGAEMARTLSQRIAANPNASVTLGPAAERLAGAAVRGQAALEAEHEALLTDDPEYAALVEEQARRQSLLRKKEPATAAQSLLRPR